MKNIINEESLRAEQSEIVEALEQEILKQKQILKDYQKDHGKLDVLFNRLNKSVAPLHPLKVVYSPKEEAKVDSPCSGVLEISDWHYGARVVSAEIENFNEYDLDICKSRAFDLVARYVKWIDVKRTAFKIPTLEIICLGDFISGDIHDELRRTNVITVPEQAIGVAGLLASTIGSLSPYFDNVIIHFLVADNHGRLTDKPQSNEEGKNHWNYVVGNHAKEILRDHSNVDFRIYEVHERVVTVQMMQYLIMHGHGIPQNFGVPWYAIERRAGREATVRMQDIMTDENILQRAKEIGFHKLKHAHFHVNFDHDLYSCNGSLEGTTAYDHRYGRSSGPIQRGLIVHPKHGEFDITPFRL